MSVSAEKPSTVGPRTRATSGPTVAERDRTLVALIGLPKAGKTHVASLAEELGYPVVYGDEHLRELAHAWDSSAWDVRAQLTDEYGDHGAALPLLTAIESAFRRGDTIVVDGLRTGAQLDYCERTFECETTTVDVVADDQSRRQRYDDDTDVSLFDREDREREDYNQLQMWAEFTVPNVAETTDEKLKEHLRDVFGGTKA